jgi:hypothetical protein
LRREGRIAMKAAGLAVGQFEIGLRRALMWIRMRWRDSKRHENSKLNSERIFGVAGGRWVQELAR